MVSANLFNGRVDPDWLLELVVGLRADVVALQEAEPRHYETLARALPHGAFHEGPRSSGMGLCLRHPPAEARMIPLAWRPAPWMRLSPAAWPGLSRPLDVVAVHIAAPHVYTPPGYGFWLRRRQMQQLEAHFDAHVHPGDAAATVVVGDFNATPLWPVYRRMAGHLSDAAVVAAQRRGRPAQPTWGAIRRGPRLLRIDHVFTRGIEAHDVHVVDLAGSDHSALVVDLPA